jgi:hypothetical protein
MKLYNTDIQKVIQIESHENVNYKSLHNKKINNYNTSTTKFPEGEQYIPST